MTPEEEIKYLKECIAMRDKIIADQLLQINTLIEQLGWKKYGVT